MKIKIIQLTEKPLVFGLKIAGKQYKAAEAEALLQCLSDKLETVKHKNRVQESVTRQQELFPHLKDQGELF